MIAGGGRTSRGGGVVQHSSGRSERARATEAGGPRRRHPDRRTRPFFTARGQRWFDERRSSDREDGVKVAVRAAGAAGDSVVDAVVDAAREAGHDVIGTDLTHDGGANATPMGIEPAGAGASTPANVPPNRSDSGGGDSGGTESSRQATDTDGRAGADVVVCVGEAALLQLAGDPPSGPVIVVDVDVDVGPYGTPVSALAAVLSALEDDEEDTVVDHPILGARLDGETVARAVTDVTLMTSDPARISEYAVHADGRLVDTFRADGVVTATPLGSYGYARASGGPLLRANTGVAVVPVAPFATRTDSWVVPLDVSVSVERDDSDVSLCADDRVVRHISPGDRVSVTAVDHLSLVRPPTE